MPRLERPGRIEIKWQARGEGPRVIQAAYWSGHPYVYAELLDDLAGDHRVVTYDARGTGESTRRGPYDMETSAADLGALVDEVGGPAVIISTGDGSNIAVRAATEHPESVLAVVSIGIAPVGRSAYEGDEGMIASPSVVDAFLEMLERDYRGALRTLMGAANPETSEEERRKRVQFQAAYCPQETAVERVRAWRDDDPLEPAQKLGDRLWILTSSVVAGPWLPPGPERDELTRRLLPEARIEVVPDGVVSRPDLAADAVRRITAPVRSAVG
jgi:pimeloyl-ACP methyl ester carboxylesterase